MKVIGIVKDGSYDASYIVEVSHQELSRLFEKGYRDELPKLKVGQEMNLAEAADFRDQIKRACESMKGSHEQFVKASEVMNQFVALVAAKPGPAA